MLTVAELVLSSEPDAAARARRAVAAALPHADPEVLDAARLVVTELVTNAQLHGAAPISVRVGAEGERVRLEVEDRGRQRLVLPTSSPEAMTGRGLSLVRALADTWGITPAAAGGKVVWAAMAPAPASQEEVTDEQAAGADATEADLDALLDAWPDDEPVEQEHTVRLGQVPTDLLLAAKRHIDNVVRELTLEQGAGSDELVPSGWSALVETVTKDFALARSAIKRQAVAAAARGESVTELVLRLPASAAEAGERYLVALDEADRLSRAARLLTLESPLLHRVFRTWYVSAIVEQLRAAEHGRTAPVPRTLVEVLGEQVVELAGLQEDADRLVLLQRVNRELTSAGTPTEIAEVVARTADEALGAVAVRVLVAADDGTLHTVAARGGSPEWVERFATLAPDADLPWTHVFVSGQPLLLPNLAQLAAAYPEVADAFASPRSLHVVPLVVGEHRLGVLSLSFAAGGERDEATLARFVQALADALAQALERAQAREAAAASARRLAFLADASVALSASLDLAQTVQAITTLFVPRLADWCVVHLLEDGRLVPAGLRHLDPARQAVAERLVERWPVRTDAPGGVGDVLRTGESQLLATVPDELLVLGAHSDEHLALLRELGFASALSVALPGRDGRIGVLQLVCDASGRRYGPSDVGFVEDVARRAALALEAAQVVRQQSGRLAEVARVADAAQKAILAPPPARARSVALAARYVSASAEALVGGDLHETVVRSGSVRMVVGDVRGKGLAAVRTTTVVLGEFRATTDVDDLADVARLLDRRLRSYLGEEDFVTAVLAEVADDGTFSIASCGHPAPLLASQGRVGELPVQPSLPLGLGADPVVLRGRLDVGDRLLLHTDGVLDARDRSGAFVELLPLAAHLGEGSLDEALDGLLAALHARVGGELGDDVALLVAEHTG